MLAIGLVGKPVDSCFEDAEKTGKLMVSNRNLRELPSSCEKYDMEDVFLIELANNKLKKVPTIIRKCMILTRLNLHNNFIREFNQDLKNLPSLKELILSRNSLNGFPLIIASNNLELLDISCNRIKTVPEDIRFLEKLKVLDVSSNSIRVLPNTIGQLGNLRCLNMSRNKLESVPEELQYCPLMKLNLSFNKLHMIPPSFRHLIGLQEFSLESNPLRHPPAKLCSLGKAHIFKYLSLLASHMEVESNLSKEEIEMQKRYREAQERMPYRPDSAVKTTFDDFEIYTYSPSMSQLSLNTPSVSALDDYRITTPEIQEGIQRIDSFQSQDYNSIYMDYVRRDHNSNEEMEAGTFGRTSPETSITSILRQRSTKRSETKRRSNHFDIEQKPVLSMYATLPRNYRRSMTPTGGDSDERMSLRIQPRVRPVLRMSPYMRRPMENFGTDEHENSHSTLGNRKSLETNIEDGQFKLKQRQIIQVSRTESTRSSSTSGNYFGAPFSYAGDLRRSTSNKYISRAPDVVLGDSNLTKNSNPTSANQITPKNSKSATSDDGTDSDTSTPKASPEPPELIISTPFEEPTDTGTPPPPPPRTFTLSKEPFGKIAFNEENTKPIQDTDSYSNSKKVSDPEETDGGSMTLKRREYSMNMITSQIDYITAEVRDRLGIEIRDFENYIQDGVLACQLVNLVQPDLISVNIPEKKRVLSTIQVTLNIEKFIEGCQQLGVPSNYMCTLPDIVHGQDISKATQSPPRQEGSIKSDLSQSLSELSVTSSTQVKKKGKRRKQDPLHTHNRSKYERDDARTLSSESLTSLKQHTKPTLLQSLRGTQVCARSSRDGLFYPGVVLRDLNSNHVIVQFADGQTDRISSRLVVPRGGARPCPVLNPGDYVLVRVRSKYGQHPNLSTGLCDYFIPAIVQMTPYKGGMTFPPSSVPVYAAASFNGRPVSSLRAGMIRISRAFFLSVCRYIQQLMVGLSTSIEQEGRHPALCEGAEGERYDEEEFRLPKSPSVETLSKLVEKQSEQHTELMERLSQVISLSSRDVNEELDSHYTHSDVPDDTRAESETFPITPTCDANVDTLSLERMRPFSAPIQTQTSLSLAYTIPYRIDQGVQVTGMQDKWTESLPSTFTQGTSTQLDDCVLEPIPDPRVEELENSQKKLLEELEGVVREVTSLKEARETQIQEHPNAFLVMQDGHTTLVPREEGADSQTSLSMGGGSALLIQDLTPQVPTPPPVVTFSSGDSVLVDSRRDGWFYRAEVLSEGTDGDNGVTVCMEINGETVWEETERLLPFSSTESRLPEVHSEQRVLAEHASFPTCYAPGRILQIDRDSGEAVVKFYDDVTCSVPWGKIQPVDAAVCSALSEIASQYDNSWITEGVVCRREHSGVFYAGQIAGKSWKTRHYMVQYPDGAIEEQSIVHVFRAPGEEDSGAAEGSFVLASPDTGLFMPGEVRKSSEGVAVVRFCHGEEKEIQTNELIVISKLYYQDMFQFITSQLQEVED